MNITTRPKTNHITILSTTTTIKTTSTINHTNTTAMETMTIMVIMPTFSAVSTQR